MLKFLAFALYLTVGCFLLVTLPIFMHPTLPLRRKLLLAVVSFLVLVPGGLALYAFLGVPPMAAL